MDGIDRYNTPTVILSRVPASSLLFGVRQCPIPAGNWVTSWSHSCVSFTGGRGKRGLGREEMMFVLLYIVCVVVYCLRCCVLFAYI